MITSTFFLKTLNGLRLFRPNELPQTLSYNTELYENKNFYLGRLNRGTSQTVRVKNEHVLFLKHSLKKYLLDADVYLIGYRANDTLKGGGIDISVIGEKALTCQEKRNVKIAFYKEVGE